METRHWAQVALKARERASRLGFGARDKGLQTIADDLETGWTAQTLRRALSAIAASEKIEAEAGIPAESLLRFPLAAVEYAARLYRRDPKVAISSITELINGEITVAQLKTKEEGGDVPGREAGKALETRYRKAMERVICQTIESTLQVSVGPNKSRFAEDPLTLADFVSADQDEMSWIPRYGQFDPKRLAIVIIGPYNDEVLYRNRAFDWTARAYALLVAYRQVVLVLPDKCPTEPFIHWRAMLRLSDDSLLLLKLDAEGRHEFLQDATSGRP
jgi:hypothetical protein